jgi:AcrR family transcriptional regulator
MTPENDEQSGPARGLDLLWGDRKRPSRGPKPGLSVERIAEAAIEVVNAEGLEALSMRRVAEALGFTPMALYRYVPGKWELIEVMVDTAVGTPPESIAAGADWREKIRRWSAELHTVYLARPWVLEVPLSGLEMGPNRLAWLESALTALSEVGLTEEEMLSACLAFDGHARAMAQIAVGIALAAHDRNVSPEDWAPEFGRLLEVVIDKERYPTLSRFLASGVFDEPGRQDDREFDFGLERLLDGIAALVKSRSSARRSRSGRR